MWPRNPAWITDWKVAISGSCRKNRFGRRVEREHMEDNSAWDL